MFIPTTRDYRLGDDIYVLLSLPDDPQRYPVAGKVAWITPANAPRRPHPGRRRPLSVRREESRRSARASRKCSGTAISSDQAHADHLSRRAAPRAARRDARRCRQCAMFVDSHCHLSFPELAGQLPRDPRRHGRGRRSTGRCASAPRWRSSSASTRWPPATTTSGAASACIRTTKTCPSPPSTTCCALRRAAQGGGHRRDRAGLLPRSGGRSIADMEWQRERFRVHIRAARRAGKPLVIHTRSASADTLADPAGGGRAAQARGGVFHCFTETAEVARAALDLGFYISFSGILTFKNAADLREVAALRAAGPLLIETDSPYLAPGAVPRQDQHAGLRAAGSRASWPRSRAAGRGDRGGDASQFRAAVPEGKCSTIFSLSLSDARRESRRSRLKIYG